MIFDPQIVAQANAFVNALKTGKRAHMRPLRFGAWPLFMSIVNARLKAEA